MNRRLTNSNEVHPHQLGYRLARHLRSLRRVRGLGHLVTILAPQGQAAPFLVSNDNLAFEGNISSFIDRELYLFGHYEWDMITSFFSIFPSNRRRVVLDVGANIGTHSLRFSKFFETVHSFEPNAALWPQFQRNVAINQQINITLHRVALGNFSADQPFYSIDKDNFGLGTFSPIEQYDLPLHQVGTFRVEHADKYLASFGVHNVDAVKIDVQGLEPEVLAGLNETLEKFHPVVWFEYDVGTKEKLPLASDIKRLFPYPIKLLRLTRKASLILYSVYLEDVSNERILGTGNYVAVPVNWV